MIASLDGQRVVWEPFPKQALALSCPAFEVMYGGAKGTGKSEVLTMWWAPILALAHQKYLATGRKQRKCRIAIFRRNVKDLKDLIAKQFELYPLLDPEMGEDGFNKNEATWTFTSGATVENYHLDGPTAHLGFNGQELVGIGFDEVQQLTQEAVSFLVAQCRSSDPDYYAARMVRYTSNPGGHPWIVPYFQIDSHPEGSKVFRHKTTFGGIEHETTRCFIRARPTDNPHLPTSYWAQLAATMTEDQRAIYIDGDYTRVVGAYFSTLLRPSVHFVKSRPIPSSWEMRYGLDWGSTNPASLHMGAQDPASGKVVVFDELHEPGISGRHFAGRMKELWARQKWCADRRIPIDGIWGAADKQVFDSYNGASAGDDICAEGFRLFPADKARVAGCNQMRERMLLDRLGAPQIEIFQDRCPRLCEALSKIESDPLKIDEYDAKSPYSHACDSLRFLLMEFPVRTAAPADPQDKAMQAWQRYFHASRAKHATTDDQDTYY